MGIRMPGATSGLFDPKVVKQLIEVEKQPIEAAKLRKQKIVEEKDEIEKLQGFLSDLDVSLNGLKSKADFYKMKVESSHPDIVDGVVEGFTITGTYEFEVRGLAKAEKELAYGFPDKNESPVGFGYMWIERDDKEEVEVVIEPGSTLQDVATAINDQQAGVKAMVINTKYKPDPYRLLVISEKSGKESKVYIDEDTTFLEFKEQVSGRNLDLLFEDVPVTDEDNTLEDLVDGVVFFIKRSEPGTRVQVGIVFDLDTTMEGIKNFVEKYNEVATFIHDQYQIDGETNRAGLLASDGTIKTIMRNLQNSFLDLTGGKGKFGTLAEIGITTDPKTGKLNLSEQKVRQSLAEDYEGVASLFVRGPDTLGVAGKLALKLRELRDPVNGVIRSRIRGLDKIIENQDQAIERKERAFAKKEESIKRRFASLEGQLSGLKSQGDFLSARFNQGKK